VQVDWQEEPWFKSPFYCLPIPSELLIEWGKDWGQHSHEKPSSQPEPTAAPAKQEKQDPTNDPAAWIQRALRCDGAKLFQWLEPNPLVTTDFSILAPARDGEGNIDACGADANDDDDAPVSLAPICFNALPANDAAEVPAELSSSAAAALLSTSAAVEPASAPADGEEGVDTAGGLKGGGSMPACFPLWHKQSGWQYKTPKVKLGFVCMMIPRARTHAHIHGYATPSPSPPHAAQPPPTPIPKPPPSAPLSHHTGRESHGAEAMAMAAHTVHLELLVRVLEDDLEELTYMANRYRHRY
jgi:hypothetical protein